MCVCYGRERPQRDDAERSYSRWAASVSAAAGRLRARRSARLQLQSTRQRAVPARTLPDRRLGLIPLTFSSPSPRLCSSLLPSCMRLSVDRTTQKVDVFWWNFSEGRDLRIATNDLILMVIRIRMRIQEFLKEFLPLRYWANGENFARSAAKSKHWLCRALFLLKNRFLALVLSNLNRSG